MRTARIVLVTALALLLPAVASGQLSPKVRNERANTTSRQDSDLDQIMHSARWKKLRKNFEEWLSVQNIYTADQVTKLIADVEDKINSMNPTELNDFIDETEEKLETLLGPEAADARSYLSVLTPAAAAKRLSRDGKLPNMLEMTNSQLRQELKQFQQRRASLANSQAAFNRSREQQVARTLDKQQQRQRASQDARVRASHQRSTLQNTKTASRYAPRRRPAPEPRRKSLYVTPWGGVGFLLDL